MEIRRKLMLEKLCEFLNDGRTSYNATDKIAEILNKEDFIELDERKDFNIELGHNYYVKRNGSSIIAFKIPEKLDRQSFLMTLSHSDCPSLKLKPNAIIKNGKYVRLNVEVYGGPILASWLDRPLSMAGRVIIKREDGLQAINVDFKKPICIIPNVAIHMNPSINKGYDYNPQVDLLPLCKEDFDLNQMIAEHLSINKEDVLNFDLFLYPLVEAMIWDDYISSHHLDDLSSSFTSLMAFINAKDVKHINLYACFDNEEVGSLTRQGAASDFLNLILRKISEELNFNYERAIANSISLSCDNAHAAHPNHPEKADETNRPYMNAGIVIKHNANQSYTSDSLGSAIFTQILDKAKVPYQYFTNRSDMRGGSTLGNISNAQVSLLSIDIGMAQLAMHSSYETQGIKDIQYMIDGIKAFYEAEISFDGGHIQIENK